MSIADGGLDIMPDFNKANATQSPVVWTLLGLGLGLVAGAAGAAWYLRSRDDAESPFSYDSGAVANNPGSGSLSGADTGIAGVGSSGGFEAGTAEVGKTETTNTDLGSGPYGAVPYSSTAHDADAVADLDVNSLDAVAAGELATGGVSADAGTPDSILSSLDDHIGVDIGGESAVSPDILQGRPGEGHG
jgi:hypothetical protein